MSLAALSSSNPETVSKWKIPQLVSAAGDGHLKDGSLCSQELRDYLKSVEVAQLANYAQHCMDNPFEKSGQVLQDIVNELGRRLDYVVEFGLYSGKSNAIGHDGLWNTADSEKIIIEVKTTDTYRISLETLASYKTKLISEGKADSRTSILIVVARQDTGDLESQVRGSRYAWDIRLISVEALLKLVRLKIEIGDDATVKKIRSLLRPFEYTRVDQLVDIVFTTAKDNADLPEEITQAPSLHTGHDDAPPIQQSLHIQEVRTAIVSELEKKTHSPLVQKSRALFWSPNEEARFACTVSKRYGKGKDYWYAFHDTWLSFLKAADHGSLALGFTDRNDYLLLPLGMLETILPKLNTTERPEKIYWHMTVNVENDALCLYIPKGPALPLADFRHTLGTAS